MSFISAVTKEQAHAILKCSHLPLIIELVVQGSLYAYVHDDGVPCSLAYAQGLVSI